MTKQTKDDNELFDENGILRDGVRLRTPMFAMDSVQKSIRDAMHPHASHHKPGYRFVTDGEARQRIDDAHAAYREELSNRWKNTPPDPVINTPAAPIIDEGFDDGEDFYAAYDRRIANQYKGE